MERVNYGLIQSDTKCGLVFGLEQVSKAGAKYLTEAGLHGFDQGLEIYCTHSC